MNNSLQKTFMSRGDSKLMRNSTNFSIFETDWKHYVCDSLNTFSQCIKKINTPHKFVRFQNNKFTN